MSSYSEASHANNVAAFEELIARCAGYGAAYNPSRQNLQVTGLTVMQENVKQILTGLKLSEAEFFDARNTRIIAIRQLKDRSRKIVNVLAAMGASPETRNDARFLLRKIDGRRSSPGSAGAEKDDPNAPQPRINSSSQTGFDNLLSHFGRLIALVQVEKTYQPNEPELQINNLANQLADWQAINNLVVNRETALENRRQERDRLMYLGPDCMGVLFYDVKKYVKGIFGPGSPEYKQISGLRFRMYK
ncbi:MAG: hypothetical protein U0U70_16600 [Chitinophagaceae bacterium]